MLRLRRVELHGFKSFCDRTELKFNGGGLAAIVGPNGCGKSNLSDAISWVLGEQSAKTLRGTRMEDVIFAGTRDRKPLGLASVTMTLVDPAAHSEATAQPVNGQSKPNGHFGKTEEITITRRLFRSGDSEYLINGQLARLRDIQDLFLGTGLGPESYAIIEQGRIGQILSSKPQDRRAMIEEAAGVSKYKTRKRLAEAKLESAKQNLSRVFDILEEVGRQVNSLKRQASKARRYGELKAEMDARLRLLLSSRFRVLEREATKAALDLNLAASELRNLSEQVAQGEQEYSRLQSACYETEKQLTELRARLAECNVDAERNRGRLDSQAREIGAIEERVAQGERESQELEVRAAALESELAAHRQSAGQLERQIASLRDQVAERNRSRESLQAGLQDREKALDAGRLEVLRLLGEASTLRNQLTQIEEYLAGIEREAARSQKEEQAAAAELEHLTASKKNLSETLARRQMELRAVTGERRHTEEALEARKSQAADARARLDALRSAHAEMKARRDSIEQVLAHRGYTTESVKQLFGAPDFRPLGLLADFVEVIDPAYEKPVEEFLHEELEYVVVESWEQANQGIQILRGASDGRATFLVHTEPAARSSMEPAIGAENDVVGRLSDAVRLTNGLSRHAASFLHRLVRCYIARDQDSARRLAAEYPDLFFLLPDGVCYHGPAVSGGNKTASGPLALKRESRELAVALASRQKELDEQVAQLENLDREVAGLESELEHLRGIQQTQEKETLALDHEMRKLAEEISRANSRLSVARLELNRLRQESERSLAQRERNLAAVEEKENARVRREEALQAERQDVERIETEAARVSEELSALRVELAALEERHRGEQAVMTRLESIFAETSARRREIVQEMATLSAERARLVSDNLELDKKIAWLRQQSQATAAEIERLSAEEAQIRESLRTGDEQLKQMRLRVGEAHERRSQLEVELVKRQSELKFLDETSHKELNCPVEELARGLETVPDAEALAEAERLFNEIKARIDALGPVNPQALEEYQEAQQRYDFLNTQRQDLLDSIRDTEKAIQEIDQVSRQRFSDAFERINAHFRETFRTLFGGGTGEMRLTDETNLAESGIDIIASPPGKKLQNVLLLSGGEKALTALALLLAIFRYQPSPFCILDEVDAPLDEPNIERLMRLLKEMSHETQFVLITHSKKTMESAEAMYGVTMQEPGVSKLVSVKFQAAAVPAAHLSSPARQDLAAAT